MSEDAEMSSGITVLPVARSAAERMRASRERRRLGLRCLTVELRETEIDVLIQKSCWMLMRVTTLMQSAMPCTPILNAP